MDLSSYKNIIIQVGGNDISQHYNLAKFEDDFESLLYAARACANKDTNIIVSGLLFRSDVCVLNANIMLENLCDFLGLMYINQYKSFNDTAFLYYVHDGIHFSRKGTSKYLKNINTVIAILKQYSVKTVRGKTIEQIFVNLQISGNVITVVFLDINKSFVNTFRTMAKK